MHIVAYLLIIIVNALLFFFYTRDYMAYEKVTICFLVFYFVCNLIFGLIVN